MRCFFLIHRYLGVLVGLLMVMWCLSGIVMMYVRYPSLGEAQRLRALQPIDWRACCTAGGAVDARQRVRRMEIETLAGRPTMWIAQGDAPLRLIDVTDGRPIETITPDLAHSVAETYGEPTAARRLDRDQWTVSGEFSGDRPLYRFDLDDAARTRIYVSSTSGKAVQLTTASQRFWNWLGAVPHWLHFTRLRANAALWDQIMLWSSLLGSVLAATGLYLGLRQFRRAPTGHWSPYRGFALWHHLPGLIFGLFALTWIVSGLVSLNPWGFLVSTGAEEERMLGEPPSGSDIIAALPALARAAPADTVSIALAPFDGAIAFIASTSDGSRRRLSLLAQELPPADMARAAAILGGGAAELLPSGDSYYFASRSQTSGLPIQRIVAGSVRYYLDPLSGAVLATVDCNARWYRWLHKALHQLDFTPALRGATFRALVMLPLMLGATLVCGTGAWLAVRRLMR